MRQDDLYLGYYLHLVQDICYRHFVYDKYHWNPMIPGNVEKLHKDYSIINFYVAEKYNLKNDITVPVNFDSEPINDLCSFDVKWLMDSMYGYFKEVDGEIFFLRKKCQYQTIRSDKYVNNRIARISRLCYDFVRGLDSSNVVRWINLIGRRTGERKVRHE